METIIQWVNSNKQPLNGVMQPNVVLGQSMGGVIARYALKDMENNSINHQTRLYISDDAPHLGANVPQGYQHLARHARSLYIKTGVTAVLTEVVQLIRGGVSPLQALSLADQPASKQMLVNFVTGSNTIDNTVHAAWQTELKNMGYPNGVTGITFRKVAISNGSECANTQVFDAGDNLLTYKGRGNTRFLGDLLGMVALPIGAYVLHQRPLILGILPGKNNFNFDFLVNAQADGTGNQVYKGKITYTKSILWLIPVSSTLTNRSYTSSSSTLPYDYFPGGYYYTGIDLNSTANQNWLFKYSVTASHQPTFNYIPTVSALDIGEGNVTLTKTDYLARYIGATPPSTPKNTPFDNFITAFNNTRVNELHLLLIKISLTRWPFNNTRVNELHISFERRNGDWMAAELNGSPQSADCSGLCDITEISGDEDFCTTSASYTIPNLPAGATVAWSAAPSGLVTINSPGNTTTTLTKQTAGFVDLTATITNSCRSITLKKIHILVGIPKPGTIEWLWNVPPKRVTLSVDPVPGATSYNWYLNGNFKANTSTDYYHLLMAGNVQCGQFYYFGVTAQGPCGVSEQSYIGADMPECDDLLLVWPNPASDNVIISLGSDAGATAQSKVSAAIRKVEIIDKTGVIKRTQQFPQDMNRVTVSVSGLPADVYTLRIFDGKKWHSAKVVVQR